MVNRIAAYQKAAPGCTLGVNETLLNWSVAGDLATVEFSRGPVQRWIFMATPDTVREVLRLVGECASDNDQILTWRDAVKVSSTLRSLVRETPVVALVIGVVDDEGMHRIYVGVSLMGVASFLVGVMYVIARGLS